MESAYNGALRHLDLVPHASMYAIVQYSKELSKIEQKP
jgi:hypothetical protein